MSHWGEFENTKKQNVDFETFLTINNYEYTQTSSQLQITLNPPSQIVERNHLKDEHFKSDPLCFHNILALHKLLSYKQWQNLEDCEKIQQPLKEPEPPLRLRDCSTLLSSTSLIAEKLNSEFFTNESPIDVSMVTKKCVNELLRKSLVLICLHQGVQEISSSCMDLFLGLLDNFFFRLSSALTKQFFLFPHLPLHENLPHVFMKCDLDHPDQLIYYYQQEVVEQNKRLNLISQNLYKECVNEQIILCKKFNVDRNDIYSKKINVENETNVQNKLKRCLEDNEACEKKEEDESFSNLNETYKKNKIEQEKN